MWPHSKAVLMQSIIADTLFLANNSIMDYSLLTGLDEENGELVVGIIGIEIIISTVHIQSCTCTVITTHTVQSGMYIHTIIILTAYTWHNST